MKKVFKFLLKLIIVILVVLIIAAALIFVFVGKDNVMAAIKGLTTSTEDIEKNIEKTEKQQHDLLVDHGFNLSEEDLQHITSGELTDEKEIVDMLLGRNEDKTDENTGTEDSEQSESSVNTEDKNVSDNSSTSQPIKQDDEQKKNDLGKKDETVGDEKNEQKNEQKNDNASQKQPNVNTDKKTPVVDDNKKNQQIDKPLPQAPSQEDDKQKLVDEQVAALVAKMYVYKAQYSGSISSLVSSMSSEYYKLPSEQQTYSTKVSIYNRYASQIATMEAQCDAQVDALVGELRALLTQNGRDTSLADSLLSAYAAEKENTKAYYVSRYAD